GCDGDPAYLARLYKSLHRRDRADHQLDRSGRGVLHHLRRRTVGDLHHVDTRALGQQLADHDLITTRRVDAVGQLPGFGFRVGDQVWKTLEWQFRLDRNHERPALGHHRDRCKIAYRIVGDRLE